VVDEDRNCRERREQEPEATLCQRLPLLGRFTVPQGRRKKQERTLHPSLPLVSLLSVQEPQVFPSFAALARRQSSGESCEAKDTKRPRIVGFVLLEIERRPVRKESEEDGSREGGKRLEDGRGRGRGEEGRQGRVNCYRVELT
jgi:hypothetical protein